MNLRLPDKHLPREEMLDMRNRMVSLVHGASMMFLAGYNTYFVHSQCGEVNTRFEQILLNVSNGYFTYDLLVMAYFGILDKSMLIHHTICIIGLNFGLFSGHAADNLIGALFLTEISNPAMHIRVVLKHMGLRYTKAYESAELAYMCKNSTLPLIIDYLVLYIFGRILLGIPVLYRVWSCEQTHIMVRLMGTGLFIQSVYFIITMISILKSRSREYAERKKKNIKMKWFVALTKEEILKIDSYNRKNANKQMIP